VFVLALTVVFSFFEVCFVNPFFLPFAYIRRCAILSFVTIWRSSGRIRGRVCPALFLPITAGNSNCRELPESLSESITRLQFATKELGLV
jgi:hypothetical protein